MLTRPEEPLENATQLTGVVRAHLKGNESQTFIKLAKMQSAILPLRPQRKEKDCCPLASQQPSPQDLRGWMSIEGEGIIIWMHSETATGMCARALEID